MTNEQAAALKRVFKKNDVLSQEQFRAKLNEHKNGDIALMMVETGAADLLLEGFKCNG